MAGLSTEQLAPEQPDALDDLRHRIERSKKQLPLRREWCRRFKLHQDVAEAADMRSHVNTWALSHKKTVFKAPLPHALEQRIRLWFKSLDKNSSGALSKNEMAAAMEMGGLPSDRAAVDKLVSMMDLNESGTVDLHEFEVFIREQVARGHLIDDSAILLPGGETLTLSHMVSNHTRRNLVQDMIAGGENRARWTDEDGEKALEAIHAQRTINEVVKHHRNNQQAHGSGSAHSKAARNNEDAETEDALNAGSSEADAVARLAAAEAAKCGYTRRQYRTRCRQFRKMLASCRKRGRCTPTDEPAPNHILGSWPPTTTCETSPLVHATVMDDTSLSSAADTVLADNGLFVQNTGQDRIPNLLLGESYDNVDEGESYHVDEMMQALRNCSPTAAHGRNRAGSFHKSKVQFPVCTTAIQLEKALQGSCVQAVVQNSGGCSLVDGCMTAAEQPRHPSRESRYSVGNIITTLHQRATEDTALQRVRDLTWRWNKPFEIATERFTDSKWNEWYFTTGVPGKAQITLRDGGLCATPELPLMAIQDLVYNKQRLKQIKPEVAAERHERCRRRNWSMRPDWLRAETGTQWHEQTEGEPNFKELIAWQNRGAWHQEVARCQSDAASTWAELN